MVFTITILETYLILINNNLEILYQIINFELVK